jgi:hypothetical protein
VSWNQPGELTEQVRSKPNLDKQVQLTEEEEDQDDILMIEGIGIFLPFSQEEAQICVAGEETAEEQSQLTMTVKRKLSQTFETAQADEGKNERSEERLNDFSQ